MKSYLLTDNKDALVGMRLAGVRGQLIKNSEELLACLKEHMEDGITGILMISSPVMDYAREEVMAAKLKSKETLIIEIPSGQSALDNDYITRYIKESIGVKF
jgi:V/A-type H+-transporting ATPase subunit F